MPCRTIRVYPDPVLKQICQPVDQFDPGVGALIQDLIDTMLASGHSVGVAAPQVGDPRRVLVVDVSGSKLGRQNNHGLLVMVNPLLVEAEGRTTMREGCMSVPDYTGNVTRAESVVVQFLDRNGSEQVIHTSGFEAVAVQHEMDHLDGLLFLDRVSSLKTDVFRRKTY